MSTYHDYFTAVLNGLGIKPRDEAITALCTVSIIEGANSRFNPLNSVVPHGNSTRFNSVGVQDYKSFDNGVAGTIALLKGGPWINVVHALTSGSYSQIIDAFSAAYAKWGSHPSWGAVTYGRAAALASGYLPGSSVTVPPPAPPAPPKHVPDGAVVVAPGDTLSGIAAAHQISLSTLVHANPQIHDPNLIHPGEVIHLPVGHPSTPTPPKKPQPAPTHRMVKVNAGDTLWGIAAHYYGNGNRYHDIMAANHLVTTVIHPGQMLVIP